MTDPKQPKPVIILRGDQPAEEIEGALIRFFDEHLPVKDDLAEADGSISGTPDAAAEPSATGE